MSRSKGVIFLFFLFLLIGALLPAQGQRMVTIKPLGPECGQEVMYRRSGGRQSETYSVHAETLVVRGVPAYQSISVYQDRVRRVTMRQEDLTPLAVVEKWNQGPGLVSRTYEQNKVRMIRRGVPDPIDQVIETPGRVHDPESFAFLLKGYPYEEQDAVAPVKVLVAESHPLYLAIFGGPRCFDLNIIPHGQKRVRVPAGTFDCYEMEVSLAGVLGRLLPKNRFWLSKQYPHALIRAEAAGETIEFFDGPFTCDGVQHCAVKAEVPEPFY